MPPYFHPPFVLFLLRGSASVEKETTTKSTDPSVGIQPTHPPPTTATTHPPPPCPLLHITYPTNSDYGDVPLQSFIDAPSTTGIASILIGSARAMCSDIEYAQSSTPSGFRHCSRRIQATSRSAFPVKLRQAYCPVFHQAHHQKY